MSTIVVTYIIINGSWDTSVTIYNSGVPSGGAIGNMCSIWSHKNTSSQRVRRVKRHWVPFCCSIDHVLSSDKNQHRTPPSGGRAACAVLILVLLDRSLIIDSRVGRNFPLTNCWKRDSPFSVFVCGLRITDRIFQPKNFWRSFFGSAYVCRVC